MKPSRNYVYDTKEQSALGEASYARLNQLLPGFSHHARQYLLVQDPSGLNTEVEISVLERFAYTATLSMTLQQHHLPKSLARQQFSIRVYLDAATSEVMLQHQQGSLKGIYPYPNPQMYQVDERAQLNRWLAQWLRVLMRCGIRQQHPPETFPS